MLLVIFNGIYFFNGIVYPPWVCKGIGFGYPPGNYVLFLKLLKPFLVFQFLLYDDNTEHTSISTICSANPLTSLGKLNLY